jgi:thiamine pyrophosphokinase
VSEHSNDGYVPQAASPSGHVLFSGGDTVSPSTQTAAFMEQWAGAEPYAIGVDGGAKLASSWGLTPKLVIGDFDSLSGDDLRGFEQAGAVIRRAPVDKDFTDLELALNLVVAGDRDGSSDRTFRTLIIGVDGGRADHFMASLATICSPRYEELEIAALGRQGTYFVVRRPEIRVALVVGATFSLLAFNGDASDVHCSGAKWPLNGEVLRSGAGRGCSNVAIAPTVSLSVGSGCVLMIVPSQPDQQVATVGPRDVHRR